MRWIMTALGLALLCGGLFIGIWGLLGKVTLPFDNEGIEEFSALTKKLQGWSAAPSEWDAGKRQQFSDLVKQVQQSAKEVTAVVRSGLSVTREVQSIWVVFGLLLFVVGGTLTDVGVRWATSPSKDVVMKVLERAQGQPETERMILGGYTGGHSLGIGQCSEGPAGLGLMLSIEGNLPPNLVRMVTLEGLQVPVEVQGGFKAPRPL